MHETLTDISPTTTHSVKVTYSSGCCGIEFAFAAAYYEPTITIGAQQNAFATTGTWVSPTINTIWNGGWGDGSTTTSTAFTATVANTSSSQTVDVKIRSASSSSALSSATYYDLGTISSGTSFSVDRSTFTSLGVPANQYIQIELTLSQSDYATPSLSSFTIYYAQDNTPPETNASNIAMQTQASGGLNIPASGWDNSSTPYFSWNAGYDSQSGIKGYCLYIGTSSSGNPATSEGLLGTSPVTMYVIPRVESVLVPFHVPDVELI